jgi:hypothetical protein
MTQPLNQNKMTAVETLLDWLGKNHYYIGNDLLEKVEELKEVEKQQIIDAYETSHISMMTSEQYYNETFKSE